MDKPISYYMVFPIVFAYFYFLPQSTYFLEYTFHRMCIWQNYNKY